MAPLRAATDERAEHDEFRMVADAATDPVEAVRTMATGDDPRLAAIATSSFGASYLRAKGADEDVIRATRVQVAQAAATSSDPRRRAAAEGLAKLPELRKGLMRVHTAASFVLPTG